MFERPTTHNGVTVRNLMMVIDIINIKLRHPSYSFAPYLYSNNVCNEELYNTFGPILSFSLTKPSVGSVLLVEKLGSVLLVKPMS